MKSQVIHVETRVNASLEKCWDVWTDPMHIIRWNAASADWFCPYAENDARTGGQFSARMEARDGSMGFDFAGVYSKVVPQALIEYAMADGRKVKVSFAAEGKQTKVSEDFDAEAENSPKLQQSGWQSILDNYKAHVEKGIRFSRFEVQIKAAPAKVQEIMTGEETYRVWTKAFNPESYFVGSWKKGAGLRFYGVDGDGNMGGMVSCIRENIPGKFISIGHKGMFKGDKDILSGPEVDSWAGLLENYILRSKNGGTLLEVCIDTQESFDDYLQETWPQALQLLKKLCEA